MVLLLKIGPGKAEISIKPHTINQPSKKESFSGFTHPKSWKLEISTPNLKTTWKIISKNGPTYGNRTWEGSHIHQ